MNHTFVAEEIAAQPESWRTAAALVDTVRTSLPSRGERVAIVGCGTSWFIAMSCAARREQAGHGETDAFAGSEFPANRRYDRVVAISRSGTTTEIIELLTRLPKHTTTLLTAVTDSPAAQLAGNVIPLAFADEKSVVQTRFATTVLSLFRALLGDDVAALARDAEAALVEPIDDLLDAEQVTFVGRGAAVGLAHEAALKSREAAQLWTEAYPAMDYRHGPISIAEPGRLVWCLGPSPEGLRGDVEATGGRFVEFELDAQAALVIAQRFAVAQAERRGLDPDHPRNLSRSVILTTE
ncbi:fructoselysine-6-P-deglycase FrlB-like protein [Cryobacterium mesophilum]|uniref:SIS domain-containing protein n=1 Tax=Terrimesophilobacter mesophilus TaxID=433647 RepID=A0A4R8VB75_9MICO|nr:SIS domain-containing protein [Terrimesophilobacter mesophilus]MBB5632820.1 fructoselysine-6-P-deglycase FrlB-like protein [Terrimesophilobacter mesophilus]TFB79606.1 SIS domain-containing protein [Terrimesophilobacter mesophilus]